MPVKKKLTQPIQTKPIVQKKPIVVSSHGHKELEAGVLELRKEVIKLSNRLNAADTELVNLKLELQLNKKNDSLTDDRLTELLDVISNSSVQSGTFARNVKAAVKNIIKSSRK